MGWIERGVAATGLLVCALCLPNVAWGVTFSDGFAGRAKVEGVPQEVSGSNVGAGKEAGEPQPMALSAAGHSVWLEWEAKSSSYFTFSTCASAIPTVLGLYVGSSLGALTEEESVASFGGPECSSVRNGATLFALNGARFQIQLDGNAFFVPPALPPVTEGPVALRVEATPPPANDDFAAAAPVGGRITGEPGGARFYFASELGYNWNATKEAGEPKHAGDSGGASVWYTWTAPESGQVRIGTCCGTANLVGVYTGSAVNALTLIQSGKQSVEVAVTAGTTYKIAVDSEFSSFLGGPFDDRFNLQVRMELAPALGGPPAAASPDTTPPQTSISKTIRKRMPPILILHFHSSEAASTFRCKADRGRFALCGASKTIRNLKPGRHKFEVAAVDAAGNKDPTPAVAHFRVPKPSPHRSS